MHRKCVDKNAKNLHGEILVVLLSQELEKLASRKLRISAHETMRIAEKLYTQG